MRRIDKEKEQMRNIKMLGLLAVSAMALVAFVGTSSAMANTGYFTAESKEAVALSETTLVNHVFSVTGNNVECEIIGFAGSTEGEKTKQQIVSPTYEGCTAFGFKATVHTNGCELKFTATTPAGTEHGEVHLEGCGDGSAAAKTAGIQLTVKVPFVAECIVDVPEQTINGIHYTNGANNDIVVTATATEIMVDVTKSTGLCPLSTSLATHTGKNGATYNGTSTLQGAGGVKIAYSNVA